MKSKTLKLLKNCAKALLLTSIIPSTLLLSSCQTYHDGKMDLENWLQEEFGDHGKKKHDPKKFFSQSPEDYIHADGWATAIPATEDWDLYISPYEPTKYLRSKEPSGTKILCPYSGKPLILGDRTKIQEIAPQ